MSQNVFEAFRERDTLGNSQTHFTILISRKMTIRSTSSSPAYGPARRFALLLLLLLLLPLLLLLLLLLLVLRFS
jgi:hypothetical protein